MERILPSTPAPQMPKSPGMLVARRLIIVILWIEAGVIAVTLIRQEWNSRRVFECCANLMRISTAKDQYALEHNLEPGEAISEEMLVRPGMEGYLTEFPKEPDGFADIVNVVGKDPQCSSGYPGHEFSMEHEWKEKF